MAETTRVGVKDQEVTEHYAVYNGDCCKVIQGLKDDSVGLSIFSPPFSDLYSYSDSLEDMGNNSYDGFFEHFGFLVKELYRVLKPGRIVAVHCMDLPTHKRNGHEIGLRDFSGDIVRLFVRHKFTYCSRHCVWKDPLVAAVRTNAIGLAHKQLVKDSSVSRMGIPDYVLAFRKPGENAEPIRHPRGLTEYPGSRSVPSNLDKYVGFDGDQRENKRSHWIWQQIASPVWMDIRQTHVLPFRGAKEEDDERHICLAKNSLVLTKERGYVAIQDVRVGERTLTHMGRWRGVLAVQKIGIRNTITVSGQGIPGLTLTPDHKLWARKSSWVRQRDGAEACVPDWVEAQHCLAGYVNLKLPAEEIPNETSPDHWWIVGRWLADGHWDSRGGIHISSGYHKTNDLLSQLGDSSGFLHDAGTAHQVRVKDPDGRIRETLSRCGTGASDKRIPPEAYTLPVCLAKSLLDGYLSGDGHFRKDRQRWMASSVSRSLLLGLSVLVQRVYGSIASVYAGRPARTAYISGRKVQCKQDWVMSFDVPVEGRYKKPFVAEDGAWKKIRAIKDSGDQEVWNIRVAEDESFTAEGCIVKNCPLQLDVIDRCLILWSNPGDVVFTPFMGVGSEVYCAVMMGRKGVGVELKPRYYRQAKKNVEAAVRKRRDRFATSKED